MRTHHSPIIKKIKRTGPLFALGGYALAIAYSLVIIVPVYYVFISSFKNNRSILSTPLSLPDSFNLTNYLRAQDQVNLFGAIGNSLGLCIATEIISLMLGFLAAYALARTATRFSKLTEMFFGLSFLIPTFSLIVPVFLLATRTGMYRECSSVIVYYTAATLPQTVLLLTSHIREIPVEIEECAEIDGASTLQKIFRIVFPITRSGVITVALLNFLFVWNEYLFALILLDPNHPTVQIVIPLLRSQYHVDYGLIAAGVVISVLPVYVIFLLFQERIMQGMLQGAVKG
jgi:multiple sugar transport system permease protein